MPLVLDYKESLAQQQTILDRYGILAGSNISVQKDKGSQ